jgi:hypothetical protein
MHERYSLGGEPMMRVISEYRSKLGGVWRECPGFELDSYAKYGYETRSRWANEWPV